MTLNIFVGDMVFISNLLGLGAHFGRAGANCVYCEVDSSQLFSRKPSQLRSVQRLYEMAHMLGPGMTLPMTCPGCQKEFVTQDDLDSDQEWTSRLDYERAHASTYWRRPPLVDIEPEDYVLCCLHLVLSLTKLIFKKRILPMLHTDSQADSLNAFLASIGVCIPKQGKVGSSLSREQTGRVRFTGPDCIALLKFWDPMVDLCLSGCKFVRGRTEWAEET